MNQNETQKPNPTPRPSAIDGSTGGSSSSSLLLNRNLIRAVIGTMGSELEERAVR